MNGPMTDPSRIALAGVFVILLIVTSIIAIHASRRATVLELESAQAAIGRWKDSEKEIVKSVPEPVRLYKSHSRSRGPVPPLPLPLHNTGHGPGGGNGNGHANVNVKKGVGVLGHMRRYSEEGRRAAEGRREERKGRRRSKSVDRTVEREREKGRY